ncbi:MAG: Stp1/IreP family PP2C-type Ser/Thr phosphatase [Acutalibacteraceae bacterium]|nr:Stp1/IreP family PP2C-type Ser/Thr phosphatase [Acutalibacteraceae bacterium]
MEFYGMTDVGKMRHSNQDDWKAVSLIDGTAVLSVVCDGMGGANAGNVASTMASNEIKEYVMRSFRQNMTYTQIVNLLKSAIISANAAVYEASCKDNELKGMGTTVVVALIMENVAYILHVGDSRAYIYDTQLKQITVDHSMVQNMVDSGEITADEALHHPNKNIITRAIGVNENVGADLNVIDLNNGDVLLMCSDGLTNFVTDEQIENELKNFSELTPQKLIALANDGGGGDNITAVVIRV